jgi:ATP-binding cassette subfamily B protein
MREKSHLETNNISDRPSSKDTGQLRFLYGFLAPYRSKVYLAFLSIIVAALMVLTLGWGVKSLIDNGFSPNSHQNLSEIIGFMVVAVCALALASFGRSYLVAWIGERIAADIRASVFKHLIHLDVGYYEFMRPGEMVSRLTSDISILQILVGTSAAVAVRNILLFTGGAAMMLVTSPTLTLFTLLIVPAVLIPIILLGKRVRFQSRLSQDCLADMGGVLDEVLSNIRTCQAFCQEKQAQSLFNKANELTFEVSTRRLFARSLLSCIVMILVFSAICGVLWIGGQEVFDEKLSAGTLSAFIFYAITVAGAVGSFSDITSDLQRAAGAVERLVELLSITPTIVTPINPRSLPRPPRGVIALHNVNFSYPTHPERHVLKNVTLSVAPGEKVAIVGPSGSGKSTILSLLLRFYEPLSGSIYVDGIDITETNLLDLRSRMSIVPQDPVVFSSTLYDNILYGNPDAHENDIWAAIEAAHLMPVVRQLPRGVNTLLGHRGVNLSGGEKQRLALARAMIRKAPILLLDEATSALDSESEKMVQDSLKKIMSTCTTLVVAHRLATVLKADRIVVLNNGIIEAVGTHAELISEDGLYRRLATLQFTDAQDFTRRGVRNVS